MRRLPRWILVALALLGTSVAAAAAVNAVRSAGEPTFRMSANPVRATMAPGGSVRYEVNLRLINGFRGSVLIGLGQVPRGTRAVWRLPDGRSLARAHKTRSPTSPRYLRSAMLPVGLPPGTKKVFVDVTPPSSFRGSLRPQVRATSGEIRRRRRVNLIVVTGAPFEAPSRSFVIIASPATRTVLQGDVTTYDLEVDTGGGPMPTDLAAQGLPSGATATFAAADPADPRRVVMTVETASSTPTGTSDLTISGTSDGIVASAATSLEVAETKPFTVTGDAPTPLSPGATGPISMKLSNPYDFALTVTELRATVATSAPGCDPEANFAVRQPPVPLVLPPGETTIEELVADPSKRPALTMRNLPTDQEACRGVALTLTYSGLAGK